MEHPPPVHQVTSKSLSESRKAHLYCDRLSCLSCSTGAMLTRHAAETMGLTSGSLKSQ